MVMPRHTLMLALLMAAWPAIANAQAPTVRPQPLRTSNQGSAALFGVSGDTDALDLQNFLTSEPAASSELPNPSIRQRRTSDARTTGAAPPADNPLRQSAIDAQAALAGPTTSLSFLTTARPTKIAQPPAATGNSLARFVAKPPAAPVRAATSPVADATKKKPLPDRKPATPVSTPTPAAIAGQVKGKIASINLSSSTVELTFPAGQQPPPGTLVKAYHTFMMGSECVGALETTATKGDRAVAKPLGNFHLGKLSAGDTVVFQAIVTASR